MNRRYREPVAPRLFAEINVFAGPPLEWAERKVWDNIPVDAPGVRGAIPYDQAVNVPGLTADQARYALFRLVGSRRARCWQEIQGMHLVARGPFRQCDRCGAMCAPGECRVCGFDPSAQEKAA